MEENTADNNETSRAPKSSKSATNVKINREVVHRLRIENIREEDESYDLNQALQGKQSMPPKTAVQIGRISPSVHDSFESVEVQRNRVVPTDAELLPSAVKSVDVEKSTDKSADKSREHGLVLSLHTHYLHMSKSELKRNGITGYRLRLALTLMHKVHDAIYLAVTVFFATSALLYLFFEDFGVAETHPGEIVSDQNKAGFHTFVAILDICMLVCLLFYFCDGFCHMVSYGWMFIKQLDASVEQIAIVAAAVIIWHDLASGQQVQPKGIIRVLIIGIIFRKLTELHLRRNPRRYLSRLKRKKRFQVQTPFEFVMNILNSLIERIP